MRLDSSGNLGLGVTPSAWSGTYSGALQIKSAAIYSASDLRTDVSSNFFYDGSTFKYINTGFATALSQVSGQFRFFTAPSGTANNAITFTQAMTLDTDGDLGIGTSTPSSKLDVSGGGTTTTVRVRQTSASSAAELRFGDDTGNDGGLIIKGGSTYGSYGGANSFMFWNNRNAPIVFGTNDTERARITSGGDFLVGTTTSAGRLTVESSGLVAKFTRTTAGGNSEFKNADDAGYGISFLNAAGTTAGSIYWTATTTTYATSSDERLKENIVDAPQASAIIDGIKVRSFDWKADGVHQRFGVIAQELEQVAPEAVGRPAGDDNQFLGVDYSKLVPMLIKEIQSLRARVAALESKGA
jgi:hypothetical protein